MTQEEIRTELANRGVIISRGNIPIFSAEAPMQMQSLETVGPCSIGAFTYGSNLFLHYAKIGRYCSIVQDVCIGLGNHRTDLFSTHPLALKGGSQFAWHDQFCIMCDSMVEASERRDLPKTVIGNDVWLGRGVLVNDDVNIGDGAIIGAGAVVTKDIPSYAVAVGVPAKIIRFRFSEDIIGRFLSLRWWDLDLASLKNIPPEPIEFLNKMEEAVASGEVGKLSIASVNVGP